MCVSGWLIGAVYTVYSLKSGASNKKVLQQDGFPESVCMHKAQLQNKTSEYVHVL